VSRLVSPTLLMYFYSMPELPEKIGRYEVLAIAGRGAMGVVYKARDPLINRIVAIKIVSLSAHLTEEQRKEYSLRFTREAQAAGNLHHPGIVTIFDVGEEEGLPYMAQEYIEGQSLSQYIKEKQVLPLAQAIEIARQVADTLAYAHREGVVHRDIKPDNILIDKDGRAVITDFGVARLSSSELTRTGEVLGTPHFMSPEQVLGKTVDGRSDLFSLGVVLYVLLTGKRPFSGDTISSICYQIVHEEPQPLPAAKGLPPEIAEILRKLLAKNPDDRFADGNELLAALDVAVDPTLSVEPGTLAMEDPTRLSRPSGNAAGAPAPALAAPGRGGGSPVLSRKRLTWILAAAGALIVFTAVVGFFSAGRLRSLLEPGAGVADVPGGTVQSASNELESPSEPGSPPVPAAAKERKPKTAEKVPRKSGKSPADSSKKKGRVSAGATAGPSSGDVRQRTRTAGHGAEKETAARPADAHLGLIVEGPMPQGVFRVYVNGKLRLDEPFGGITNRARPRRKGFRIEKHMKIPPGEYKLRFELVSPRPRLFYANGAYDLKAVAGEDTVLKIEPRRFPARLKVKEIPVGERRPAG